MVKLIFSTVFIQMNYSEFLMAENENPRVDAVVAKVRDGTITVQEGCFVKSIMSVEGLSSVKFDELQNAYPTFLAKQASGDEIAIAVKPPWHGGKVDISVWNHTHPTALPNYNLQLSSTDTPAMGAETSITDIQSKKMDKIFSILPSCRMTD